MLIRTREAADALGATKLDRPEWIAVHPRTRDVYATLTNGRGWDNAVNPRTPNPYGHIIRWREHRGHATATSFTWDVFVLAGDPAYDPLVDLDQSNIFGSPTGCGSTRTAACGSRPTSPPPPRTWPPGATTTSRTTRCSRPTRTPARSVASWWGRADVRSPA